MKIRFGKMTGQNTFAGCFRVFGEIEKKKKLYLDYSQGMVRLSNS